MKVLLLGVGMQGKAALHDLVHSEAVLEIIAADVDLEALQKHVSDRSFGSKVRCEPLDASQRTSIDKLMAMAPNVVIDLLPVPYMDGVAASALEHGVHLLNTNFVSPAIKDLAGEALAADVTILPEFGLDPGIDLLLLGEAMRSLDSVDEIASYGAGLPELEAADNPLRYKVTWTFDGVLRAYYRPARVKRNGAVVEIKANEVFRSQNVHAMDIEGLGELEAYPNGDALKYAAWAGIDPDKLRNLGAYSMRWPGHSELWSKLVDLHLLDDEPVMVKGVEVDRRSFLAAVIGPHIQLGDQERDVAVVRIEARGLKDGRRMRAAYQLLDRRDLETGFTAMSRTVGFTASIGAQLIGTGRITKRGLLAPARDIPYELLMGELAQRGISISSELGECE